MQERLMVAVVQKNRDLLSGVGIHLDQYWAMFVKKHRILVLPRHLVEVLFPCISMHQLDFRLLYSTFDALLFLFSPSLLACRSDGGLSLDLRFFCLRASSLSALLLSAFSIILFRFSFSRSEALSSWYV